MKINSFQFILKLSLELQNYYQNFIFETYVELIIHSLYILEKYLLLLFNFYFKFLNIFRFIGHIDSIIR